MSSFLTRIEHMLGEGPSTPVPEAVQSYREAQKRAQACFEQLRKDPKGDIARLCRDLLTLLAFRNIARLADQPEAASDEIALLAQAIKDLAMAESNEV
jgi:hypothetical protein